MTTPVQQTTLYGYRAYIDTSKMRRGSNGSLVYQLPNEACYVAQHGGGVIHLCCPSETGTFCVPLPITVGPLPSRRPLTLTSAGGTSRSGSCFVYANSEHNGQLYICCDDPKTGEMHCVPIPITLGIPPD